MLELSDIQKYFGNVRVLNGVNLRLESGFVYTLKGGNGSGKTTLINIISGFLAPTEGIVEFKGKKITNLIKHLKQEGKTILQIEHNIALVGCRTQTSKRFRLVFAAGIVERKGKSIAVGKARANTRKCTTNSHPLHR